MVGEGKEGEESSEGVGAWGVWGVGAGIGIRVKRWREGGKVEVLVCGLWLGDGVSRGVIEGGFEL